MLPALRKILTRVCAQLIAARFSTITSEKDRERLVGKVDFVLKSIPANEIITLFAQECRRLKMLSMGRDFDLHDVVSFIADFDDFFDSIRYKRDWHADLADLLLQ